MDPNWVAALATLISALIIALTAAAAFAQLRHNRNANDIVVYLHLIERMDSAPMFEARQSLAKVAEQVASDPVYRERLADVAFQPEEFQKIGRMLGFLEHIAVLVTKGGIAESLVLAEYADTFLDMWELMRPGIEQRRVAYGPYIGRAFEHLAMRAKRYIDSGEMAREYDALERDRRDLTGLELAPASVTADQDTG